MSLLSEFPEIRSQSLMNKMMQTSIDETALRGDLKRDEPMSHHTSWKTGGNADFYYSPADIEDLAMFIAMLPKSLPIFWVGNGSNLLVRDAGVSGAVVSIAGVLDSFEILGDNKLKLGAGLACAKAARNAAKQGLSGIEFLAGIPGTIGGALAMNAGAYGGDTWQCVEQVEIMNRSGDVRTLQREQFEVAYRSVSIAKDEWFISATVKLEKKDSEKIREQIRTMLSERADAQPLGQLSCGSVFRNPEGDYAARLIEACGLKGHAIGGACVSDKHANFIINTGSATSTDIEQLIEHVRHRVAEKFTIELIPEVRMIGDQVDEVSH